MTGTFGFRRLIRALGIKKNLILRVTGTLVTGYPLVHIYKVTTWLIFYLSSCCGRTRGQLIRRRPMGVLCTRDKWLPNWSHSSRVYYNNYLYIYIYIEKLHSNWACEYVCECSVNVRICICVCTSATRVYNNDNKIIIAILRAFYAYYTRSTRCAVFESTSIKHF